MSTDSVGDFEADTTPYAASAVIIAVSGALTVFHGIFLVRHRALFFIPFIIGLLGKTAGYAARIFSHYDTLALGPYYLQVAKKRSGTHLAPDRGLTREAGEIPRQYNKKMNDLRALDAPDDASYQWCQTRGLTVIGTVVHGEAAVLPIGMAQVSSIIVTVKKGDCVRKADEISYFLFGGSDIVIVFEKRVYFRDDLVANETKSNVTDRLATFKVWQSYSRWW
ncbi:phosphatidylserine decarboxylase-domain-containing protein [Aspergillus navahoensis]